MGEEGGFATKRAPAGLCEPFLPDSHFQGLFGKVAPDVHRLRHPGIRESQSVVDLRAHLITIAADGRSQMKEEFSRVAPELRGYHLDAPFEDAQNCASPSGMKGANDPVRGIHKKHRHTVRHGHTKQNARGSRKVAIGVGAKDHAPLLAWWFPPVGAPVRSSSPWGKRRLPRLQYLRRKNRRRRPFVQRHSSAMDLSGVSDPREIQTVRKGLPGVTDSLRRRIGEAGEVADGSTFGSPSARCTLDEPGELGLPLRVDPEARVAGMEDFFDFAGVNPGVG